MIMIDWHMREKGVYDQMWLYHVLCMVLNKLGCGVFCIFEYLYLQCMCQRRKRRRRRLGLSREPLQPSLYMLSPNLSHHM